MAHRILVGFALIACSCAGPTVKRQPIPFEETRDLEMMPTPESITQRGQFVRVGPDGRTFRRGAERFIPFGCNYYDPATGWPPQIWKQFDPGRVEEHFRVMKSLGVNCVRVFLTAQSFVPDGQNLNPEALSRLEQLLAIAQRHQILVQVTGPDHWEGNPEWRAGDFYTDKVALSALSRFWELLAGRFRNDPRIFSYDILNEPHLRWSSPGMQSLWPEWLQGRYHRLEDLHRNWGDAARSISAWSQASIPENEDDPNSACLYDYQCFREDLGTHWVAVQSQAIRAADPNHLITVGLIQRSGPFILRRPSDYAAVNPFQIAPYVDFMTVHFYPIAGDPFADEKAFQRNLNYLQAVVRYVDVGMPVVLGEFGWYGGGAAPGMAPRTVEDQLRWNREAVDITSQICVGWFNWAFADTPEARDLSRYSGLVTAELETKPWGEEFRKRAKLLAHNPPRYRPPTKTLQTDYRQVLTSSEAARAALEDFQKLASASRRPGIRCHERLIE